MSFWTQIDASDLQYLGRWKILLEPSSSSTSGVSGFTKHYMFIVHYSPVPNNRADPNNQAGMKYFKIYGQADPNKQAGRKDFLS